MRTTLHAIRANFSEPPVSLSSNYQPYKDDNEGHDEAHQIAIHKSLVIGKNGHQRRFWMAMATRLLTFLRWILLDSPYFVLVLSLVLAQVAVYFHDEYIVPQFELLEWNVHRAKREITYYKRICTAADQTTFSPTELILDRETMTAREMVDKMLTHGISVIPNLLSVETAQLLRETIIKHNTIEENFGVISNQHRYSYGIRMEQDDIVRTAVREISTHPTMQQLLPPLIGDDPALYKFHAITSAAGAADQYFHWDVKASASAVGYSRTFAPIYSLFIPLQHTPVRMGPTDLCPGSHVCSAGTNFCEQTAFQILLSNIPNATEPVWPATYGALMNQQTTHRGRAHTWQDGPDRVLFILAITPRPRTEHVSLLETRSLSLGGSYAIHWTQWGHTWSDLHKETMYNPVKTLRSLGWYKPKNTKWGRAWLMTALLQLANGDYWDRRNLESYIQNGGLSYIPKFFHAKLPTEYATDEEEDKVWYFFFVQTIQNVIWWIPFAVIGAFALYTVTYMWVQLIIAVVKRQGFAPVLGNFRSFILRMILLHGVAVGVGILIRNHIDSLCWSKHIRQRKMFTLPKTFPSQPELPSTLPVPDDVLMLDDFQSDFLASYTRLFDVGHPGNARWKERLANITRRCHYPNLPTSVQDALQESLVHQVETEAKGRFLMKNSFNQWARMRKRDAKTFVHKELLRSARYELDVVLREIAFLRSETKFGTWRDSALHRRHIPQLLNVLEERIGAKPKPIIPAPSSVATRPSATVFRRTLHLRATDAITMVSAARPVVSSNVDGGEVNKETIEGPYSGAWLQVGDRVDALYSESETYWYPGTIVDAKAHSNKWVVEYDNYEGAYDLCRYCVLPLKPLEVGDTVEVSYDKTFYPGKLQAVHDDSMDFVFSDTPDKVFSDIPKRKYRRPLPYFGDPSQIEYELGEPVFAWWNNKKGDDDDNDEQAAAASKGKYYAAIVVAIEYPQRDVYTLLFSDNDEISGIHARDLLPMTYYLDSIDA